MDNAANNRNRFTESMLNVFDEQQNVQNTHHTNAKPIELDQITVVSEQSTQNMSNKMSIGDTTSQDGSHNDDIMFNLSTKDYIQRVFGSVDELKGKNLTFREKMKKILHSNYFHIAVVVLVLLDSIFVTIDLVLDIEAGEKKKSETTEVLEEVFKYLGFIIISVFMVEIICKLIFIPRDMLKSKLEIFDAFVVVTSFIIDAISLTQKNVFIAIAGLLTLLRFWRIIRIANGIVLAVEQRAEAKINQLKTGLNALIKENDNLRSEIQKKKEEIIALKERCGLLDE